MYTTCILKSEDGRYKDVVLADGAICRIGRTPYTGIKDLRCSKKQIEVTANFQQGTVLVVNTGSNDSEAKGETLRSRESRTLKNGDSLNILVDKYKYVVVFEPENGSPPIKKQKRDHETTKNVKFTESKEGSGSEDDTEHREKVRENLGQMKASFMNFFKPQSSSGDKPKISSESTTSPTNSWTEVVPGKLFHFKTEVCHYGPLIAAFDMDGTIIATKSGKIFPVSVSDWKLLLPVIPSKLQTLVNEGFQIVFFTNQKGISYGNLKPDDFRKKLEAVAKVLSVPLQVLVSSGSGVYRKPLTGMWDHYMKHYNNSLTVDMDGSFYVGDAAGRPANWEPKRKKDFSCSDRLFALNCGLKFYTPEEYFLKQKPAPFSLPDFDPKKFNETLAMRLEPSPKKYTENEICQQPEVIVFVGFPGAGKSFFAKKYLISKGYVHINRDTLGTHQKCQALCDSALSKGGSVVVDNTNPDRESRRRFTDLAKKYNVKCRCFIFHCDIRQAQHNIVFRELTGSDQAKVNIMVLNSYKSKFEQPTLAEGFQEVVSINFVPCFKSEKEEKLYKMYLT